MDDDAMMNSKEEKPSAVRSGARPGFVGAFAETVRKGTPSAPVGRIGGALLVLVLAGAGTAGAGVLLRGMGSEPKAAAGTPAPATSGPAQNMAAETKTVRDQAGGSTGGNGTVNVGNGGNGQPAGGGTVAGGSGPGPAKAGSVATTPATGAATAATAAKKAAPITYAAFAGIGCDSPGASYAHYGWYKNGNAGWWTLASGSTTNGGCTGSFDDMPMSGDATKDTSGQAMMYGFKVGAKSQSCSLWLYVPHSASARDVAAKAVHVAVAYGTTMGNTTYTSPAGDHVVDQRANHDKWVSLGTYKVYNGAIGIRVTNRGNPYGYPETYPHIAGGAAQVRCVAL